MERIKKDADLRRRLEEDRLKNERLRRDAILKEKDHVGVFNFFLKEEVDKRAEKWE